MKIEHVLFIIIGFAVIVGAAMIFNSGKSVSRSSTASELASSTTLTMEQKAQQFKKYREIVQPAGFVNTNDMPITIGQYIGKKVVLLDVMTYSCINCQRTFPYLNDWYTKYEDEGLVIIGIHTPEFAFEKSKENVAVAMKQFGIMFPVVLDNDYGTWNAYGNNYWPRKYLIDIDGYVVYDHIGEGEYGTTEKKIVELLNERAQRLGEGAVTFTQNSMSTDVPPANLSLFSRQSPETYLGSARNEYEFTGTGAVPKNKYALGGEWKRMPEYSELVSDTGTVTYHFFAQKVHFVAEAALGAEADILVDGIPVTNDVAGDDVSNGKVNINNARLYTLVSFPNGPEEHTLEIKVRTKGLKAYTFTFS